MLQHWVHYVCISCGTDSACFSLHHVSLGRFNHFSKLASLIHFNHNVTTTNEFSTNIELRNRRPITEHLDTLSNVGIGQNIYTPDNTETYALSGGDRPYAGWLYVGLGVVWKNERVRNSLLLDIGVVGSYSYAQESQRYVHDARGFDHPNGWDNQLHNEIGFILAYERTWRFPHIVKRSGFDWEFMPHAGAALGNVKTHANLGAELRFGLNLPDDFGTGVIGPASSTSTPVDGAMGASRSWFPLGMYVFARMDGRAVGRNVFLDGNTFGDSHSVGHRLFVADISAGIAFNYKNTKLAYAFVYRTKEFDNQLEPQVFGTVSLNWTF